MRRGVYSLEWVRSSREYGVVKASYVDLLVFDFVLLSPFVPPGTVFYEDGTIDVELTSLTIAGEEVIIDAVA